MMRREPNRVGKRFTLWWLKLALLIGLLFPSLSLAQPVKVRMGVASKDSAFTAAFVAEEAGIAKKHGLQIEFVVIAPPTIPAALMGGDLHFAAPAQTVSRSAVQGLPVVTVAIMMDRPNYTLLADRSIKTVDDLRAKTIVTGAPTSGPGAVLVFLLEDLGFNPSRDVKILFIGDAGTRRAMLYQRQAQAGLVNLDLAYKMQRKDPKLHPLVLPNKMPRVPFAGLGVSRKFLKEKPEIVERMIRANLEANQFIKTKPDESQKLFAKLFELTADESRQLWESLAHAVVPDGLIGDDLFKIALGQDAKILKRPDLTEAQVRAAYDLRLAEKVAREMNLLRR